MIGVSGIASTFVVLEYSVEHEMYLHRAMELAALLVGMMFWVGNDNIILNALLDMKARVIRGTCQEIFQNLATRPWVIKKRSI